MKETAPNSRFEGDAKTANQAFTAGGSRAVSLFLADGELAVAIDESANAVLCKQLKQVAALPDRGRHYAILSHHFHVLVRVPAGFTPPGRAVSLKIWLLRQFSPGDPRPEPGFVEMGNALAVAECAGISSGRGEFWPQLGDENLSVFATGPIAANKKAGRGTGLDESVG